MPIELSIFIYNIYLSTGGGTGAYGRFPQQTIMCKFDYHNFTFFFSLTA